jgi:hypothetical protein
MRNLLRTFVLPALLIAACTKEPASTPAGGNPTPATAGSTLAGKWLQDTGTDAEGITLDFHGETMTVHGAPRADGTHDHPKASYTFDAATKAITVKSNLLGPAKADTWTGTLGAGVFELTGGTDKLKFKTTTKDPHAK